MGQLLRTRVNFISISRFVNSQTQLTEPTVPTHARSEKVDTVCEHIRRMSPPFDWNQVRSQFSNKFGKGLPFAFEIRTINCIITSEPEIDVQVAQSLLQYIDPTEEMIGKNPIFDLHIAALAGRVDPDRYAAMMKRVVNEVVKKHSSFTKFKAFSETLTSLASTSRENCIVAVDAHDGKGQLAHQLSLCCLSHGMHEQAMACCPIAEVEPDLTPWFNSFEQFAFQDKIFKQFLSMLKHASCCVSPACSKPLEKILSRMGYEIKKTELDASSHCTVCRTQISGISEEEYAKCISICRERVLNQKDVFINSTPKEVDGFIRMVDNRARKEVYYDVVIDGLNVSHLTQPTVLSLDPKPMDGRIVRVTKSKDILVKNLTRVLNSSISLFPRILMIGRRHMCKWPGLVDYLESKKANVDAYFIDDISNDDPFIIYAAMQSPKTYVMTNDLFRDHKFLMDDMLFERWLRSRIVRVPKDARSFALPPKHENRINFSSDWSSIHIPVAYNSSSFTTWLCCHKK